MSNTKQAVTTKSGRQKDVLAGHKQTGFVAGSVNRMSALFMADVGELANIDTTTKNVINDIMAVCIEAVNEKYKPAVKLVIADYDFKSGKFSRTESKQPAEAPAQAEAIATPEAPAQAETPAIEVPADTPAQPTSEQLNASCVEWLKVGKTEQEWSDAMLKAGVTQESINNSRPAESESVAIPTPAK